MPVSDYNYNLSLVCETVNIEKIYKNNDIIIFPNPASNNISVNGIKSKTEIRIIDIISGNLVFYTETEINYKIDTKPFNSGIYLISIESNIKKYNQKIVIQKDY